jgi:hypothetical protein
VKMCRDLVVVGVRNRGKSKKTWQQCVNEDIKKWDSKDVMSRIAQFRRTAFFRKRPTRVSADIRTLKRCLELLI